MQKHLCLLLSPRVNFRSTVLYYKLTLLACHQMKPLLEQLLSVGISTMFWVIVAVFWLIIKGFDKVPIFLYFMFVGFAFTFPPIFFLVLSQISKLSANSKEIKRKCVVEAEFGMAMRKVGQWKMMKARRLEAYTLKRFSIRYEPFLTIDEDFVLSVSCNQLNRLFDAVMIF